MRLTSLALFAARLGAVLWIVGSVIFNVFGAIAQAAWTTPYTLSNTVSDLGNVTCQRFGDDQGYVCSPLHTLMNAGLITDGACIIIGLLLTSYLWRRTFLSWVARGLIVLGALGVLTVGFVPSDTNSNLHVIGAYDVALVGNIGLTLASFALRPTQPGFVRWLATIIGVIGLIASILFNYHIYLGIGLGGMERFAVYNLQVWTLLMGLFVFFSLIRRAGTAPSPSTPTPAQAS